MSDIPDFDFDLCSLEELQQRFVLSFEFIHPKRGRHEIGVFWDGTNAFALENYCPHEFGMLTHGFLEPGEVTCPLHAAVFDLREGNFKWIDSAGHNQEGKVRLDTFLTVRAGQVGWREGRLMQMGNC